jgi:hypothetical protein
LDNIIIDYKYKLFHAEEWLRKSIAVSVYFDLSSLDEEEQLDIYSVPMYNNLIEYIDCNKKDIHQIYVDIVDVLSNRKLHFFQTFWNNNENWLIERIDSVNERIEYHELIISTVLPREISNNSELDYEIMRFQKKEDDIKCLYHGVVRDNADGSQSEIII